MRLLTARLSAKRRSRFAGPVVLLLALLVTGGFYAAALPRHRGGHAPPSTDDVAKGRALFLVGCSSCHGKNGEGIDTQDGGWYGPSLVGVGAAAVDFQVGTGRMPMAAARRAGPGQAGRRTPRRRPPSSRRSSPRSAPARPSPTPEKYDPETIPEDEREEAIVRGGEFFRTNCTACHNFAGIRRRPARRQVRPHAGRRRAPRTSTRRCSPARSRCRSSPTRSLQPEREARHHRLPAEPRGEPELRRLRARRRSAP